MHFYFLKINFVEDQFGLNDVHTPALRAGESLLLVVDEAFDNHLPEVHVPVPSTVRVVAVNRPTEILLAGPHI